MNSECRNRIIRSPRRINVYDKCLLVRTKSKIFIIRVHILSVNDVLHSTQGTETHQGRKKNEFEYGACISFDKNMIRTNNGRALRKLSTEHVVAAENNIQVCCHLGEAASVINRNGNQTTCKSCWKDSAAYGLQ